MKNLATHQEVHPEELTRRYDVLTTSGSKGNGTATNKKVTINFWYSLGIKSLRKMAMKGEDYLEITIDMGLHRKLTTGWQLHQKPRYAVLDIGVRIIAGAEANCSDLIKDVPLEVGKEIELEPSDDEEGDYRGTRVGPRHVDLIAGIVYKPSPPRQVSGVTKTELDQTGGLYRSLYTKNPPSGISRASSSTPNNGASDNEASKSNVTTPDGKQGDNTLTNEDQETTPNNPPRPPKIFAESTQSQVEQRPNQNTQDGTKVINETLEINLGQQSQQSLREIYAKSVAESWNNSCVICQEKFHQTSDPIKKKKLYIKCSHCNREYDSHPSARCILEHEADCPPHCRAHHHYHMLGKLFEEKDGCIPCSKQAWVVSKIMSIFENDPYNYEPIGEDESERDEDDSDEDTEHHEISPITEDLVTSITVSVDALKKNTKRSQAEMVEMKEMTMNIMSKVSKLDESVKNIQTNTTRTWETVGKIDQKIDQNKENVQKLLTIKNEPIEGAKNLPTTIQNGET